MRSQKGVSGVGAYAAFVHCRLMRIKQHFFPRVEYIGGFRGQVHCDVKVQA